IFFETQTFNFEYKYKYKKNTYDGIFDLPQDLTDKLKNKKDSIDVLHIGYFFFNNHSIYKLVKNIVKNSLLSQDVLEIKNYKLDHVIEYINYVNPKILHIHFNSKFPSDAFGRISNNIKIIS